MRGSPVGLCGNQRRERLQRGGRIACRPTGDAQQQSRRRMAGHYLEDLAGLLRRQDRIAVEQARGMFQCGRKRPRWFSGSGHSVPRCFGVARSYDLVPRDGMSKPNSALT